MQPGTIGQYLLNEALPEELRDPGRVWDGKTANNLFSQMARQHPDAYPEIMHKLNKLAAEAQGSRGGFSPSVRHMKESEAWKKRREVVKKKIQDIWHTEGLSREEKQQMMTDYLGSMSGDVTNEVFSEADKSDNPFAWIVKSGMKGKPANLNNLLGSPLLFANARNKVIPVPILRGYAKGLTPSEYWAASYGTRKGLVDVKLGTGASGYLCLAENTLVRMADGSTKEIRYMSIGDMVVGVDENNMETRPVRVSQVFNQGIQYCWRTVFVAENDANTVICLESTDQHKIYGELRGTSGGCPGWVRTYHPVGCAGDLWTFCLDGKDDGRYYRRTDARPIGQVHTYDIEVEAENSLFVLANGLVVSNSKQLVQIGHRAVVTSDDDDNSTDETRGLPVDTDDDDNIGTLLARSVGDYPRNTIVTAKVLRDLKRKNIPRILVRSPMVGGPEDGGVYANDVGIRENGRLMVRGENPGVLAAHALSEPLSQSALSSKHTAGVAKAQSRGIEGFQAVNQMIQVPQESRYWASHAKSDGTVQKIEKAPQGGHFVYVNNESVYVPTGVELKVKPGDVVEAGDILSGGLPNPSAVVEHKGIGEGRRYFTREFTKLIRDSGLTVNRRNVELLAKGLVNHVELDGEIDAYVPGDKIPYSLLERHYEARPDAVENNAAMSVGKYLERPVLHYTIGTKIRPSVVKELEEFGLGNNVLVHDEPPVFRPRMVRGMAIASNDPDWVASMQGSGIKSRTLRAVHRGDVADPHGTSFVTGVVMNQNFGKPGSGAIESPLYRLEEMRKKRQAAPLDIYSLDDRES